MVAAKHCQLVAFLLTCLLSASSANWLGPFDAGSCRDEVLELIASNASITSDPALVVLDSDGQPLGNYTAAPVLTEYGCNSMCASQYVAPSNTTQRLLAWFIPIFLLITNLNYPDIGKSKYFAVFHLLGDPISSNLALLLEMDSWDQYSIYGRDSAVILTALGGPHLDFQPYTGIWAGLCPLINRLQLSPPELKRISAAVRDCRSHEIVRAWGALGLYLFQVVAAFWAVLGGSPMPSGGMIGPAMILSWLLPVVLLSNAVGSFVSQRARHRAVAGILAKARDRGLQYPINAPRISEISLFGSKRWYRETDASKSLAWSGGMQLYQPSLLSKLDCSTSRKFVSILFWLALPTAAAFAAAFGVLDTPPTYLTCRGFVMLAIYLAWVFSFIFSIITHKMGIFTGVYAWRLILAKDFLVASAVVILLVGTSSGWFTSCWCLSGRWNYAVPRVYLFATDQFTVNSDYLYPIAVGVCLGLQLLVWAAVSFRWRKAFRVWKTEDMSRSN